MQAPRRPIIDRRLENRIMVGPRKPYDIRPGLTAEMEAEDDLWDVYLAAECLNLRAWLLREIKKKRHAWLFRRKRCNGS
jgi:hypothetical protein